MSKEESVIQAFGSLTASRLGLSEQVRHQSVAALNRLLAHTMAMRDLYKKSHWQTSGATFYELHLLFDKHYGEQVEIMDALAERVQTLGGVTLALAHDVAEETRIARAPRGRESVPAQLRRLVEAHEFVLGEARPLARAAAEAGDDGTNDLINHYGDWWKANEAMHAALKDKGYDVTFLQDHGFHAFWTCGRQLPEALRLLWADRKKPKP